MTLIDRIFRRPDPPAHKATFGGPALVSYSNSTPLSVLGVEWQDRARAYLAVYPVGWFYKAGSRISRDFANLAWTLSYEDAEGDNEAAIVAAPSGTQFESLDPLEQFLRLAERPNPYQSGRSFRQQQQIRLDFTGRALVYLEGGQGGGLPTALYGVSPDRMWKSHDSNGHLVGWVLDKNRASGGVPFEVDEILSIEYPGAGDDPIGVVESVYAHVPLTKQLPQHTSDVLSTGGRLAGMAWPKERSLDEDEFQDAQRAWRSVASDPNAARRLLLFPEPMEYAAGAASPTEIGIPALALLNQNEILTAFPINPFLLGVPQTTGLNSGESLRYVKLEYWEGTQHPRVEIWEDAFQQQLIPRYEAAVGRPLDFDIEEPNLDDAPTLIEKVGAFKGLIAIGFDPKDAVGAVALDHIKWNGLPAMMDPAKQADMAQQAAAAPQAMPAMPAMEQGPTVTDSATNRGGRISVQEPVAKAHKARRDQVIGEELPAFGATMRGALTDQRDRLAAEVERVIGPMAKASRKALPDDWWDQQREDQYLKGHLRGLYVRLARTALSVVSDEVERFVLPARIDRVTEQMLVTAGSRVTGINETTRKAVADAVSDGVRRGYSIGQIVNGVPDEQYHGVKGLPAFDEARAELVARTETMLAYNQSALLGYREYNVSEVQAIDGDFDTECAERNGQTFSIDDALAIEDHPNGTLDWAPLTEKHDHSHDEHEERMATLHAFKAIAERELPQPIVNVNLPQGEIRVPVTVNVPEQTAPVVNVTPDIRAGDVIVNVPELVPPTVVNEITVPQQAAPVVNVQNTMPEPFITVEAPVIPAPIVNVTVPEPRTTTKTVTRRDDGSYEVTERGS